MKRMTWKQIIKISKVLAHQTPTKLAEEVEQLTGGFQLALLHFCLPPLHVFLDQLQ
jgi:hypothetical protein